MELDGVTISHSGDEIAHNSHSITLRGCVLIPFLEVTRQQLVAAVLGKVLKQLNDYLLPPLFGNFHSRRLNERFIAVTFQNLHCQPNVGF